MGKIAKETYDKPTAELLKKPLSLPQRRFLKHYLATGEGRNSAKQAGYKCKDDAGFSSLASQMLVNPYIKAHIDDWIENAPTSLSPDEVIEDIAKIAMKSDSTDNAKLRALELLGRHFKLFTDQLETKQNIDVDYTSAISEIDSALTRSLKEDKGEQSD